MAHRDATRGRFFGGQRLEHAEFAEHDLRGASFAGADLHDADFTHARTGMRPAWALGLTVVGLFASVAIGVLSGWLGQKLHRMLADPAIKPAALTVIVELALFMAVAIVRGLARAVREVFIPLLALAAVLGVVAIASGAGTGRGALAFALFTGVSVLVVTLGAAARAMGGATSSLFFFVVAVAGAIAGKLSGGGWLAVAIAFSCMLIGRRALKEDARYLGMSRLTALIACRGGTSFRGADLSGARFSDTRLVACDFRGAKLDAARFDRASLRLCLFDGADPTTRDRR
jgi:hypothetical protein